MLRRSPFHLSGRAQAATLVFSLVLGVTGCGGADGPPREAVQGTVSLDGAPLEKGMITFSPEAGGDLVVSGLVVDGAFSIPAEDGPGLGPHRVQVWSRKATGRTLKNKEDPEAPIEERVEIVPPRYNLRSELKAEVVPGGENQFAYELAGGKPAAGSVASGRPAGQSRR